MKQHFQPPPEWPVPSGWTPSSDWRPDPAWPPAPPGWQFWVDSPVDPPAADLHAEYHRQAAEHLRRSGVQQPPPTVVHPETPQPAADRGAHPAESTSAEPIRRPDSSQPFGPSTQIPVAPDQPTTAVPVARRYPPQPTKPTGTATIIFGVISLMGALPIAFLGAMGQAYYFHWYPLLTLLVALVNLVGIIGALASARTRRRSVAVFCAIQGIGLLSSLLLLLVFQWGWYGEYYAFANGGGEFLCGLAILAGAIGVIVSGARAHAASTRAMTASAPPQPAGYAADGRAFYPIVGYAGDGRPITADQVLGYRPPGTGTNSMAVTAFILAFTITVLAIPFGHVARAQIRRTGEQGAGLALAALIIGYTSIGILLIVGIAFAVMLAN